MTTTLPSTMTAIDPEGPGGPEVLVPVARPVPAPGPGEVLIRVHAAGVNRPDVLQRKGGYALPPGVTTILGHGVAGALGAGGGGGARGQVGGPGGAVGGGGGSAQVGSAEERG